MTTTIHNVGLIWDLKTKRGDSNIYILRQLLLKQKSEEDFNYHNWIRKNTEENIYQIINK